MNTSRIFFQIRRPGLHATAPYPIVSRVRKTAPMYTWVRMVRDCGVHYSKYAVGHVVKAGWSALYKSENVGTLPYSSGVTVRTGYMPEIATLRIDIFLRLFNLCLRTGYRLLKIITIILAIRQCVALVRCPILSALPYDKDLRCPNGWICPYAPPFFCITVRTDSMLIKFIRTWAHLPTLLAFVTRIGSMLANHSLN